MKTTTYFEEEVLQKRPQLQREWCERVIANPIATEVQPDSRIRFWGIVPEVTTPTANCKQCSGGASFTSRSRLTASRDEQPQILRSQHRCVLTGVCTSSFKKTMHNLR